MRRLISITCPSLAPVALFVLALTACDPEIFGPPPGDGDGDEEVVGYDERLPPDDDDGVPAARDFCPETSPGAEVDADGCADNQLIEDHLVPASLELQDLDEDGTSRPSEAILSNPPATGQRHRGFVVLVAASDEEVPVILYAHEESVTETGEQIHVSGPAALATSDGFLVMEESDLTLDLDEAGEVGGIEGEAQVPLPEFGLLGGAEITGFQTSLVGFDTGANLEDLNAPLAPERHYLYFHVANEAGIRVGPLEYSKSGPDATVVFDPKDPMVFLRGSLVGLGSLGPLEDVGIGLSFGGHLPFEPKLEDEELEPFRGHAYLEGVLSVSAIPVAVEGDGVLQVPTGSLYSVESTLGMNGTLTWVAEIFGIFKVDLELVDSTTVVKADADEVRATFVGVPADNFLNEGPIDTDASFLRGVVSSKVGDSFLIADGNFGLDGVWLSAHTPFQVADIPLVGATARVDASGATITGRVDLVPELPGVSLSAGVEAEVYIPTNGEFYEITFRGDAEIDGVFEANAVIVLGPGGVTVGAGG